MAGIKVFFGSIRCYLFYLLFLWVWRQRVILKYLPRKQSDRIIEININNGGGAFCGVWHSGASDFY